jgi:hypothetical protein
VENILRHTSGVEYATSVVGFSLLSFARITYNPSYAQYLTAWRSADA